MAEDFGMGRIPRDCNAGNDVTGSCSGIATGGGRVTVEPETGCAGVWLLVVFDVGDVAVWPAEPVWKVETPGMEDVILVVLVYRMPGRNEGV